MTLATSHPDSLLLHLDLHRTTWEKAIRLIREDLQGTDDGPTNEDLESAFRTLAVVTGNPTAGMRAFHVVQLLASHPVPKNAIADLEVLMWDLFLKLVLALQKDETRLARSLAVILGGSSDDFRCNQQWWLERAGIYMALGLPPGTRV
jgi:hypothetical protein